MSFNNSPQDATSVFKILTNNDTLKAIVKRAHVLLIFLQLYEYNLGNGFTTTSPAAAMDEYVKREFKEIVSFSEEPHDVVFIPDTFQYGPTGPKVYKYISVNRV